ncbi:hypothetical protein [Streptomyces citrinus]|uniref:hypothetical protein n=1 Tax=Streptomyces citrinus TaxID=3118173 RepID=UPI003CC57C14
MLLPPGAEGPAHAHHDLVAFLVLEGEERVGVQRGAERPAEGPHPAAPAPPVRP